MQTIELFSPAKINVGLYVGKKRKDGYHNISSLMVPLQLFDEIKIKKTKKSKLSVICKNRESNSRINLPQDEDNICFKTAKLVLEKRKLIEGIEIEILKKIPLGAGLGGGSSNAASLLLGLNQLFDLKLTTSDLVTYARNIGSDVPFFIYKTAALVEGRGENVTPIHNFPMFYVLLICPGIQISTKDAYSKLDSKLTALGTGAKPSSLHRFLAFEHRLDAFNLEMLKNVKNCFENVVFDELPELKSVKRSLYNLGAELALMTGSGSTVFALFSDKNKAGEAFKRLELSPEYKAFLTNTI